MQTPTTPVVMNTPLGKLYVAVAPAKEDGYHEKGRGNVTDLLPVLWVATDPAFEADPDAADHWMIRGRAYAVHYHLYRNVRAYGGDQWHRDTTPHAGGFRNDRRGPVEFGTKTWGVMWDTLEEAVDAFAEQYPDWDELSRYLRHASNAAHAETAAAAARREADKQDKIAEEHHVRRRKTGNALPDTLLSWITGK